MSVSGRIERADRLQGLRRAVLVFTSPRALFTQVEDTAEYGWALVALLALVILLGYAEVKTGLIDRDVDRRTEHALKTLEESQAHLVDRIELSERMEDIQKTGEFNKLLARLGVVVFSPASMLASILIIAAILYAAVALTGRKPEYHTLMSICVYAAFIELLGCAVRLAMIVTYRTTDVDTSLAMLSEPGMLTPLVAVDPFRIWFWGLVILGLIVTRQLSRRMAMVCCILMGLIAAGARVGLEFAAKS